MIHDLHCVPTTQSQTISRHHTLTPFTLYCLPPFLLVTTTLSSVSVHFSFISHMSEIIRSSAFSEADLEHWSGGPDETSKERQYDLSRPHNFKQPCANCIVHGSSQILLFFF